MRESNLPFLERPMNKPTIYLPKEYVDDKYYGNLYGFYTYNTNVYNVIYVSKSDTDISTHSSINKYGKFKVKILGKISKLENEKKKFLINGWFEKDKLVLKTSHGEECNLKLYSLTKDIFSRNSGIIDSDMLLNKKILISGCGSVGSYIAVELAKLGVGHFVLVDHDVLSYENVCRHQCGIPYVGMYKVDAVASKITEINPIAQIETFQDILENLSKTDFEKINSHKIDLIIGSADNRQADLYANRISKLLDIPFVSIGFWERAFAGEIFYSIPNETPCYYCTFGNLEGQFDKRKSKNRRFYSFENDTSKINFEPGITLDINFISTIGLKIILDLINKNDTNYRYKVLNYLTNFTLICNHKDEKTGGNLTNLFDHPLQITNSIKTNIREDCPHCKLKGKFYE